MRPKYLVSFLLAFVLTLANVAFAADTPTTNSLPFVSPMFGDSMVLQRGKPNTIWGWSQPGDSIRVDIADRSATGVAAADGRWQVKILPPPAGGPYTIKIQGRQNTVELHEVLVGDVWLCGGQSNMAFGLMGAKNGAEEVKTADHPLIRYFTVKDHPSYSHVDVPAGTWKIVTSQTVGQVPGISAAAYFFARKLQDELHIPIGLVVAAMGGTPAESWTSAEALKKIKDFDIPIAEVERLHAKGAPEYGNYIMHWYDEYDIGVKNNWSDAAVDDTNWKPVQIPGNLAEMGIGDGPGVFWFRKEITVSDPVPAGKATLFLGSVERMDTAYVNGQWVGASSWVENPRAYNIPAGALKPGRNVITVRVFRVKPQGGFLSKPEVLRLALGDGTSIPLAGTWKGQLSVDAQPPHPMPIGFENWPTMPSVLYRGMLAPIAPLAITGALWYQGEQNSERAYQYRKILPTMIADWRQLFGQGDFPFYVVSLPKFMQHSDVPTDGTWAEMRESQAVSAKSVPHSCLVVTIDTGEADNIHPKDKKEVGDRLALCALAEHYGKKVVYSGPTFASVERLSGALKIHFDHTDGGLVVKGDKLGEFAVAGEDQKWYWADAKIEGDTVIVSSPSVPNPKEVRYAWQSNPAATLFNGAGLPAAPFRTDQWQGITDKAKPF